MADRPSVGRIVHYVAYGTPGGEFPAGVCRAAVITEVDDDGVVGLCVTNPTGLFFNRGVRYDFPNPGELPMRNVEPGTWHWPERV